MRFVAGEAFLGKARSSTHTKANLMQTSTPPPAVGRWEGGGKGVGMIYTYACISCLHLRFENKCQIQARDSAHAPAPLSDHASVSAPSSAPHPAKMQLCDNSLTYPPPPNPNPSLPALCTCTHPSYPPHFLATHSSIPSCSHVVLIFLSCPRSRFDSLIHAFNTIHLGLHLRNPPISSFAWA